MSIQKTKIAIQGECASFHEIAAHDYYQTPIELIYCQTFEDVFSQLVLGIADQAFVAVKNSSHGCIQEVVDLLNENNVSIQGQYDLRVQQHLIGLPGTKVQDIKRVVSHPVALSQCSLYISELLHDVHIQDFHDTAAAVAYVKNFSDPSVVAIGSEAAARLYGLEILSRAIQNDDENVTTFRSLVRHSDKSKLSLK